MNKVVQKGFGLLFFVLRHMLIHIIIKSFCLFLGKLLCEPFQAAKCDQLCFILSFSRASLSKFDVLHKFCDAYSFKHL